MFSKLTFRRKIKLIAKIKTLAIKTRDKSISKEA